MLCAASGGCTAAVDEGIGEAELSISDDGDICPDHHCEELPPPPTTSQPVDWSCIEASVRGELVPEVVSDGFVSGSWHIQYWLYACEQTSAVLPGSADGTYEVSVEGLSLSGAYEDQLYAGQMVGSGNHAEGGGSLSFVLTGNDNDGTMAADFFGDALAGGGSHLEGSLTIEQTR